MDDEDEYPVPGWKEESEEACVKVCRLGYGRLRRRTPGGAALNFNELERQCSSRAAALSCWADAAPVTLQEITPAQEQHLAKALQCVCKDEEKLLG